MTTMMMSSTVLCAVATLSPLLRRILLRISASGIAPSSNVYQLQQSLEILYFAIGCGIYKDRLPQSCNPIPIPIARLRFLECHSRHNVG